MDEPPLGTTLSARPSSSTGHPLGAGLPVLEPLRVRVRPTSMSFSTSMPGRPITSHLPYPHPQREGCRPAAPSSSTPAQHALAPGAAIWSLLQPLRQPLHGPRAASKLPRPCTFDPLPMVQRELPPLRGHSRTESWRSSTGEEGGGKGWCGDEGGGGLWGGQGGEAEGPWGGQGGGSTQVALPVRPRRPADHAAHRRSEKP